jgi:Na+-driven multidrug efflux pump
VRISALGVPFALIALAGQGYLRGVANLRTPLLIVAAGNAVNVVLEVLFVYGSAGASTARPPGRSSRRPAWGAAFVVLLLRPEALTRRPRVRLMAPLLRMGGDLVVRTGALLGSFLVASAVLARVGEASLGAHQVAFQLFVFLALVLDALAIAGQVIVGRSLGTGDADDASAAARRMIVLAVAAGTAMALVLLALEPVVPGLFTDDPAVIERAEAVWPLFALMQPAAAAVFALDGILIGAGDTRYLAGSMLVAGFGVYVPISLLALHLDWGITGVWCGLLALMATRLLFLAVRFRGRRWVVLGSLVRVGHGMSCSRIARSSSAITVLMTSTRAYFLLSPGMTCQRPPVWSVRSSISAIASSYCGRFSRLRQSSSVSFQLFSGSSLRASKRLSCSSSERCIQNLTRIIPSAPSIRSNSTISS